MHVTLMLVHSYRPSTIPCTTKQLMACKLASNNHTTAAHTYTAWELVTRTNICTLKIHWWYTWVLDKAPGDHGLVQIVQQWSNLKLVPRTLEASLCTCTCKQGFSVVSRAHRINLRNRNVGKQGYDKHTRCGFVHRKKIVSQLIHGETITSGGGTFAFLTLGGGGGGGGTGGRLGFLSLFPSCKGF